MPEKNCKDNELNIAVLDNRVKAIEHFVGEINENHLPHIYKGINDLKIQQAYWAGGITAIVILSQILIKIYIH